MRIARAEFAPCGCGAATMPESPYVKMDASWAALQARAQTAARAAQQLDPEVGRRGVTTPSSCSYTMLLE